MTDLPLFPLPRVVFPTEPVPLHVFEPRYRAMVAACLVHQHQDRPADFAIIHSNGNVLAPVGCTLRITQVLRRYPDGRLDIMARGLHRCRLVGIQKIHAYDTASVERLPDTDQDWDEALATRAFALHRHLLEHFCGQPPEEQEYTGQAALSWLMAPSSGLSVRDQQALLEQPRENDRLQALVQHFSQLIAQLQEMQTIGQQIQAAWELRHLARNDPQP